MASTIMYSENRFVTHIIIMSMSLSITASSRPYVDVESNVVAIMFCVVDILGAISAGQSFYFKTETSGANVLSSFMTTALVSLGLSIIVFMGQTSVGILFEKETKKINIFRNHLFLFGLPMLLPLFMPIVNFQMIFVLALLIALVVVVGLALKATGDRIRILNDAMLHGTDYRSIWKAYTTCEVIFLFPILVIVFFASFIAKRCLQKKKKQNKLTTVSPSNARNNSPRDMNVITSNDTVFI